MGEVMKENNKEMRSAQNDSQIIYPINKKVKFMRSF